MPNFEAWKQIKAEADRLGWPEVWATDLDYDKAAMYGKDAPLIFGWSIRRTGTDLFTNSKENTLEWAKAVHESGGYKSKFFWFDGAFLEEVDFDVFLGRLKSLPPNGINVNQGRKARILKGATVDWVYGNNHLYINGVEFNVAGEKANV